MAIDTASLMQLRPANWWREMVIYQIYPRSYQDSNNDGIGDLRGIIQRLPYLEQLGVDTIWLSPIFPSPMKDFGYDVTEYCDIEPLFGNLTDFDELVQQAHARGLRIMIDQVLSHTSNEHPWFKESRQNRTNPKADWYVWANPADHGGPPNNWLSIFGGSAWTWDTRRRQYYLHNFLVEQPDLNFHNPEVQDALLSTMHFWLERGVDGFRLDTANFYFHDQSLQDNPPHPEIMQLPFHERPVNNYEHQRHLYDKSQSENLAFLARMRQLCDQYSAALLGEIGCDHQIERMVEYTAPGRLHTAYGFALLKPERDAEYVRSMVAPFIAEHGNSWPTWSLGNHDCTRVATRWADKGNAVASREALECFAVMQMTLMGIPCIYQGEELGLPEQELAFEELVDPPGITFWPEYKGRDGCRTPMPWAKDQVQAGFSQTKPWLPMREPHISLSVDQQEQDKNSLLHFYRHLLHWRKQQPALLQGLSEITSNDANLLEYTRTGSGQTLHIRLNLTNMAQTVTPLKGQCILGSNDSTLPAYGYVVVAE